MSPWDPKLPTGFLLRETGRSAVTRTNGHTGRGPRPQGMASHKSILKRRPLERAPFHNRTEGKTQPSSAKYLMVRTIWLV